MSIRNTTLLAIGLLLAISANASVLDFLFPESHLRYQADVLPLSIRDQGTEVRLSARFTSSPFDHLQNNVDLPMDYLVWLKFRAREIQFVCIDSLTISNRDSVQLYRVGNLNLAPVAAGKKEYNFGTLSLDNFQPHLILSYQTGVTNILGRRFYNNTHVSFSTNSGYKHVFWSENAYTFQLCGRYGTQDGKEHKFTVTEPMYLYFDGTADRDCTHVCTGWYALRSDPGIRPSILKPETAFPLKDAPLKPQLH